MNWEPTIGLEVHCQLQTKSKLFSGSATAYGASPNSQTTAWDVAIPGKYPTLNKTAVDMAIKFGLAINATINQRSIFARKHYFYPDSPKGYQITQDKIPIIEQGTLTIQLKEHEKTIGIERTHLEGDAGKSLHDVFSDKTALDFNRVDTPLIEIVSAPELGSAVEAVAYLKALHTLVRYLDICDGNMQEGSFRCDANVSVKPQGETKLGTRVEIKNINSFRFVEQAINYEIDRQIDVIENGGSIMQETRLFNAHKQQTFPMRSKENAEDYHYFTNPCLMPLYVSDERIADIKSTLPELPKQKQQRFQDEYGLSAYDANVLTSTLELATYYETTLKQSNASPKLVTNWVMGELAAKLNAENLSVTESKISTDRLAGLLQRITDETISGKIAKTVFDAMWNGDGDADTIIEKQGLKQVTDTAAIEKMIDDVIAASPKQLEQYRAGKDKLFGYFVGQVMKATAGKANPQQVNQLLKDKLQ